MASTRYEPSHGALAVEGELRELLDVALAAWPGVRVDTLTFLRHVDTHTAGDRAALRGLHVADLFLACACAAGDRAALDAFAHTHLARVPEFLARLRADSELCDDVRQILSEKLLVPTRDARPRILEYSGRGALAAWVRVATVRTALSLRRQRREEPEENGDAVARLLAAQVSPELEYVRRRYATEFAEALRAAFAALSPDQRVVLRMHTLKGLTGDQIASTLQLHRATVVRWIARAREDILREATRHFREHARVAPSDLESLVALLRSHVDVSLSQLLGVTE